METRGRAARYSALIVGSAADEFVRHTMGVLGRRGVEAGLCDVYGAVGRLAKREGEHILVLGRLGLLGAEGGRFFRIASENGFECCCLADGNQGRHRKLLVDAFEAGVRVIGEIAEVEGVVDDFLGGGQYGSPDEGRRMGGSDEVGKAVTRPPAKPEFRRRPGWGDGASVRDKFRPAQAELDALLGEWTDGSC